MTSLIHVISGVLPSLIPYLEHSHAIVEAQRKIPWRRREVRRREATEGGGGELVSASPEPVEGVEGVEGVEPATRPRSRPSAAARLEGERRTQKRFTCPARARCNASDARPATTHPYTQFTYSSSHALLGAMTYDV
jgi:hypothetical protein